MAAQKSLHGQVATLNENIDEFNEFIDDHGFSKTFPPLRFLGSPNAHQAEEGVIDHWDEFLQFSQQVLNADSVPRDDSLAFVDTINRHYKETLIAAQEK